VCDVFSSRAVVPGDAARLIVLPLVPFSLLNKREIERSNISCCARFDFSGDIYY